MWKKNKENRIEKKSNHPKKNNQFQFKNMLELLTNVIVWFFSNIIYVRTYCTSN